MKKSELEIALTAASEDLAGTCKSFHEVLGAFDDEGAALAELLAENEQFCCETCGWWSYSGEIQDEDGNCSDCSEEISG